jgi:hypothetical protein
MLRRIALIAVSVIVFLAISLGIAVLAAPSYVKKQLPVLAKRHAALDAAVTDIRYTAQGIAVKGLRVKAYGQQLTVQKMRIGAHQIEASGVFITIDPAALSALPKSEQKKKARVPRYAALLPSRIDLDRIECSVVSGEKTVKIKTDAHLVLSRDLRVEGTFPVLTVDVLGSASHIAATFASSGGAVTVRGRLVDAQFDPLLKFLKKDDQLAWGGLFGGTIALDAAQGRVTALDVALSAKAAGTFSVKQEKALSFVKENYRLDDVSYRALVDNMKNYRYNASTVTMKKEGEAVMLIIDLSSIDYGTRHFEIALHGFL